MKKIIIFFVLVFVMSGCFAIVDESSGDRKVRSFGITKGETLNILEQADSKPQDQKQEIFSFQR